MALIVEDGTIVANADAFGSVADADIYFSDRNDLDWEVLDPADKEMGILYATRVISQQDFKGCIKDETQTLAFPRKNLVDAEGREIADNIVPLEAVHATFEEAKRVQSRLPTTTLSQDDVPVKRVKAGSAEVEFAIEERAGEDVSGAQIAELGDYTLLLLRGLLESTSGFMTDVRPPI